MEQVKKTTFIAFVNRKGGVTKTTSSVYVATALSKYGKVLLKDSDPQGSATEWLEDIEDLPFNFELANQRNMRKANGYDYVVIDTPPGNPALINEAINVADFVIIPAEPSAMDISSVYAIVDAMKPDTLHRVLLTKVNPITKSFRLAKEVLDEEKIPRFEINIPRSEGIKNSFGKIPKESKELEVYEGLVKEILELTE